MNTFDIKEEINKIRSKNKNLKLDISLEENDNNKDNNDDDDIDKQIEDNLLLGSSPYNPSPNRFQHNFK